jgi:hypothetical protein
MKEDGKAEEGGERGKEMIHKTYLLSHREKRPSPERVRGGRERGKNGDWRDEERDTV